MTNKERVQYEIRNNMIGASSAAVAEFIRIVQPMIDGIMYDEDVDLAIIESKKMYP